MKRLSFRTAIACLALVVGAGVGARSQEAEDLSSIPARTATLFAQIAHKDYDRASFSFGLGLLGDEKFPERRAHFDLRYGGLHMDGHNNWFDVAMTRDSRSQLKDLGAMDWADVHYVPVLFANPTPPINGFAVLIKDGKVAEISPQNVHVKAVAGHMYVLHVKGEGSDFYVLFRVESITPEGECTISWKRVPSPPADQPTAESAK